MIIPRTMINRLAAEKSPYLLQHAYNPVDWYPWNELAFKKAQEQNKPIFISIGYSTCHWCHVMARESFDDHEVAEELNKNYVSIKIDREERPDVDHIYMTVCQMMTGSGGWPLTVIATPEGKPFFVGTYFPKRNVLGSLGLLDILKIVSQKWSNDRQVLIDRADQIIKAVSPSHSNNQSLGQDKTIQKIPGETVKKGASDSQKHESILGNGTLGAQSKFYAYGEILDYAFNQLSRVYDKRYGGFGTAPKFPTPHNLMFLLRYWKRTKEKLALRMVEQTVKSIYSGGIFDHIGFGFFRYSTDAKWLVPHFEKMLYDNAMMLMTIVELYRSTKNPTYERMVSQVVKFVQRDMTSPQGGFYSAIDAESEGKEGKFYVWTPEQVIKVLGEKNAKVYCKAFNIRAQGEFHGKSIPHLGWNGEFDDDYADDQIVSGERITREKLRIKMFEARRKRVHPAVDDKVLTSWNALMISALAKAYLALAEPKYLSLAEKSAQFIFENLVVNGQIYARYRDGHVAFPGYLDDYAFFTWALLDLYQATFKSIYLKLAVWFGHKMIDKFWDKNGIGFFMTSNQNHQNQPQLIFRPKETYDGAVPAGNSVATMVLLRLSHILEEPELEHKALYTINGLLESIKEYPRGYGFMLCAIDYAHNSAQDIQVLAPKNDAKMKTMINHIRKEYFPGAQVIYPQDRKEAKAIINSDWGELFQRFRLIDAEGIEHISSDVSTKMLQEPALVVCQRRTCSAPITDIEQFEKVLNS